MNDHHNSGSTVDGRPVRLREVPRSEFLAHVRNGRVISQQENYTMYRVPAGGGDDLFVMMRDEVMPDGWFRGVARGHFR